MSCRHCGRRVEPGEGVSDPQLGFDGKTGEVHELCERFRDLEERAAAREASLMAKLDQLSARIDKLLVSAVSAGRYSMNPEAVRKRRLRGCGEFAGRDKCPASPSEKAGTFVPRRPLVVRSVTAQNEIKKKSYAGAPIPRISFVRLHHHFGALRLKLTGQSWYAFGEIPPEEKRHARELLQSAASIDQALKAVDLFARFWSDTGKGKLQFSYRHLMFTKDKIERRKGRLWFKWPKNPHQRQPKKKHMAIEPVLPPRPPVPLVKRSMPDGAASARDILRQLASKGVRAAGAR